MATEGQLKFFHGPYYSDTRWSSLGHKHCKLCKTKSTIEPRFKHWSRGFCRSCYKRLSVANRLYNDFWSSKARQKTKQRERQLVGKKEYKKVSPKTIRFTEEDITTLLDRYDWRCAYSAVPLQCFDYKRGDAFQVEYILYEDKPMLVPVSRIINCSKKSLQTDTELRAWANRLGIIYPFNYITPEEYRNIIK